MRELRDDSLVDLKFMMEDSGMGKTFIYSEIKKGKLPSPHKIGSASTSHPFKMSHELPLWA
ncbi:hypothetical protein OS374_003072 [Salmonella enterica]|nr:hypothetical protein [Salmonella enterica]EKD9452014.1 hypothetical protein [Salmonella enterica]